MADPFSIFTGALTVADVCVRMGDYLKSVHRIARHVNAEIESLENEINSFKDVYIALQSLCESARRWHPSHTIHTSPAISDGNPSIALWTRAAALVREGKDHVESLEVLIQDAVGTESHPKLGKLDDLRKAMKLKSKLGVYDTRRRRLTSLNMELSTMLTAVDLYVVLLQS